MNKQGTRKALGRGLSNLIPTAPPEEENVQVVLEDGVVQVEISKIRPNPYQPRTEFNEEEIKGLAESIENQGLLQPVVLRKKDDYYEIISGERRFRAFNYLNREKVPCLVKEKVSDREMLELALVENIQREQLNEIEKAVAYQKLLLDYNYTHDQLSKQVGKSRVAITNTIRLLNLPEEIQGMVRSEQLSGGHARALLSLESAEKQLSLAKRIVEEKLSVRDIERETQEGKVPKTAKKIPQPPTPVDPDLAHQIERLQYKFGTQVRVTTSTKGGKVEIDFYSNEDLVRIFDLLLV